MGIRWIALPQDGEQIKVVSIMYHPDYDPNLLSNDFKMLQLEKPSTFKPAKLAAADDSDYGYIADNGPYSYELNELKIALWDNRNCTQQLNTSASMLCAGGTLLQLVSPPKTAV